jgi:hypothetical protein
MRPRVNKEGKLTGRRGVILAVAALVTVFGSFNLSPADIQWTEQAKLVASDAETSAFSLAISSDYIIVGSAFHSEPGDPFGVCSGAADSIFERRQGMTWH